MSHPIEEATAELHELADLCAERYLGGTAIVFRLMADDYVRSLGLTSVRGSLWRCAASSEGETKAAYQMAYDAIVAIEARVAREREEESCPA